MHISSCFSTWREFLPWTCFRVQFFLSTAADLRNVHKIRIFCMLGHVFDFDGRSEWKNGRGIWFDSSDPVRAWGLQVPTPPQQIQMYGVHGEPTPHQAPITLSMKHRTFCKISLFRGMLGVPWEASSCPGKTGDKPPIHWWHDWKTTFGCLASWIRSSRVLGDIERQRGRGWVFLSHWIASFFWGSFSAPLFWSQVCRDTVCPLGRSVNSRNCFWIADLTHRIWSGQRKIIWLFAFKFLLNWRLV